MKKLICIFIFCCVFCLQLPLSACTCSHEWIFFSDTTTCENNGLVTYKCDICGEKKEEERSAYGHKWEKTSSTATCLQEGFDIYTCKNCNKIKKENVKATGHSFYSWGKCKTCGQFKYDISLSISLPKTLSYYWQYNSGEIEYYSKCQITTIDFETQEEYLVVFFYGAKTYDRNGAYGNKMVTFTYVLKDLNGNIITSNTLEIFGLVVNQKLGPNGYYGINLCKTSSLSSNKKYILEVVDKRVNSY